MITKAQLEELKRLPPAKLLKMVQALEEKYRYTPRMGLYAEAEGNLDTGEIKSGYRPWRESPYFKNQLKSKYQNGVKAGYTFDVPDIRKRSDRERVEHMAKRLLDAIEKQPWEADMILRGAVAESYKRGNPVSFDEMKQVVAPFIEQAAKKQARSEGVRRRSQGG